MQRVLCDAKFWVVRDCNAWCLSIDFVALEVRGEGSVALVLHRLVGWSPSVGHS